MCPNMGFAQKRNQGTREWNGDPGISTFNFLTDLILELKLSSLDYSMQDVITTYLRTHACTHTCIHWSVPLLVKCRITCLRVRAGGSYGNKILYKNLKFFDKIFVRKSCSRRFCNALCGEKILLMGKCFVWAWFRQTCICSSMRGRYKIQSAEGWKWQRLFS